MTVKVRRQPQKKLSPAQKIYQRNRDKGNTYFANDLIRIIDELFDIAFYHPMIEGDWHEWARRAGVCYATVWKLGHYQTRQPRLSTVAKLAWALGHVVTWKKGRIQDAEQPEEMPAL